MYFPVRNLSKLVIAKHRIQVGVVGIGIAALNAHIPAIVDSNEFELVAICDRDSSRLDYALRRWKISVASTSLEEFLAVPSLEAVIVATPPDSHWSIVRAALERDKSLLIEKPLAPTVRECREMVDLASERGVCLFVGHEKRFHPTFDRVRRSLCEGVIGIPFYGGIHWASNAKMSPENLVPEGFLAGYQWRWRNRAVGGGIIQDHLPHYVDLIRYWMNTDPVAVYAQTMNVARDRLGWAESESVWEDLGIVVVRFSDGFILRFETGTVGRSLSPLWSLGSGIGEWTEYGYILGAKGQLLFDMLPWDSSENGRLAVWQLESAIHKGLGWSYVEQPEPNRRRSSPTGAAHIMFAQQLREFAKGIHGLPCHAARGEDGVVSVATVEAAYKSAESQKEWPIQSEGPVTPLP